MNAARWFYGQPGFHAPSPAEAARLEYERDTVDEPRSTSRGTGQDAEREADDMRGGRLSLADVGRIGGALLLAVGLTACESGIQAPRPEDPANVVARVGNGSVQTTVRRLCDGPHLLYLTIGYRETGIAVIPNGCGK